MGECYSRKSVAPGSETPERSSITSASSESNTQQRNKIPIQLFCSTTPNPSQHHQKESLETRQMAFTLAQFEALEICLKEAEEKAKSLSEQLAASEGTKSKLLEQVSWLEGKLQALDHKEDSGESYQKIVLAKDQHIEKLQAELKTSQEQLTAHKLKHKRKLKKLQTDLATAKQEAAITVLELNEKIRTLCEGKPAPRANRDQYFKSIFYHDVSSPPLRTQPSYFLSSRKLTQDQSSYCMDKDQNGTSVSRKAARRLRHRTWTAHLAPLCYWSYLSYCMHRPEKTPWLPRSIVDICFCLLRTTSLFLLVQEA
ncbi:coiled-coil domain-containing protein 192 isoform X3 [Canis lupus baileyi]|uniref:coiled-coil domain-containing protein 192 isoform X3 n=1 Tax=Canis lupus baileyi TaxID=143281 RepID=UPI003B973647